MSSNKTAIITGANKGIGKAISIGLAKLNYQTILIARNQKDLQKVSVEIIGNNGITPQFFALDITNSVQVKNTINEVIAEFGQIDVLINNAGVYFDGTLNISEENFSKMLEINLTAQFNILKEIVPVMKKQKSGYIFNVASRSGFR